MNGNNELSQIDILNRQDFIEKIISTVEYHSKNNLNTSFSVQGEWGCGKSWILDRVFERLYDIQDEKIAGGRYCVFRYNAWKYDYYYEPLVSLLISLKEQFNSENSIIFKSQQMRENYEAAKKMTAESLLNGIEILKKIPLFSIIDSMTFHIPSFICLGTKIKKDFEKYKEDVKNEIRQYDPHYNLNQLMNTLIDGLNKISKKKTIVVIVDELDRCLPEHAIKVLERMHHISQNVSNIQFIYGIDKTQIENNVVRLFFNDTSKAEGEEILIRRDRINKYLSKFISFGLQVPKANYTVEIKEKYLSLFKNFSKINTCNFDLPDKIRILANSVTPRTFELVIHKTILTNGIINKNNENFDNSILVFELFFAIARESNYNLNNAFLKLDDNNKKIWIESSLFFPSVIEAFNKLFVDFPIIIENNLRYPSEIKRLWCDYEDDNKAKPLFESAMVFYFDKIKNSNNFRFEDKDVVTSMNKNVGFLKQFCDYYMTLDM